MAHPPRRRRPRPSSSQPGDVAVSNERVLAVVDGGRPDTSPRVRRARTNAVALSQPAYVAVSEHDGRIEYQPHKTAFFRDVNRVQAKTHVGQMIAVRPNTSLASQRGYAREDLFAVAEVGYNYLMNGGLDLALTLFEGLVAVAPDEAYFAQALGLTHDRMGDPAEAYRWYTTAAKLDPSDARPDLNRAELEIEAGRRDRAAKLLSRAAAKASAKGQVELENKATAVLRHLNNRRS